MYFIKINGKEFGPYEGTINSKKEKQGNILPIFYDNAPLDLEDRVSRFSVGYKVSKNLLGAMIKSADLINEVTGEVFSFQVSNIFVIKVVNGDPEVIALVGEELKLYKNFGKQLLSLESDGDKLQTVPLGAFNMFVSYDENFYYPVFLDAQKHTGTIERFYDYYGYKSYTDIQGNNHFILLIEGEDSNETKDAWYFVDNFKKISKRIDFGDDTQYIEEWELDEYGDIYMTVTNGETWYLDQITGNTTQTKRAKPQRFTYTRYFEDTDHTFIVGKNEKGLFIIDRTRSDISQQEQSTLKYFSGVHGRVLDGEKIYFFMEQITGEIDLVNVSGNIIAYTDLQPQQKIKSSSIIDKKILEVTLESGEKRKYILE